jgi:hypothetical protein
MEHILFVSGVVQKYFVVERIDSEEGAVTVILVFRHRMPSLSILMSHTNGSLPVMFEVLQVEGEGPFTP